MKQVLIRQGRVVVEEMPSPVCGPGDVLVRTAYSMISTGTESATLRDSAPAGGTSTWANRVRKVGDVVRMAWQRGVQDTAGAVRARLEGPSLLTGYSLSGTVIEVGDAVSDLVAGQPVACAGAASAHHAEVVAVPRNLTVAVPADLPLDRAAAVTLGAIALQGVRQADVRLGEVACVCGLGLIGQLTVALLRASGCRVVGVDLDPSRVERARALGLELGLDANREDLETAVRHMTAGHGADVALLTASTESSELTRQAVRLVRRRGRVVVVGSVGLDLEREPLYMREAELRISCSYGPGRYDPAYEQRGQDYPYGYVRWTENRNMGEFLRLAALGAVPLDRLLDRTFDVEQAGDAYRALGDGPATERPLGVLLRYPGAGDAMPAPTPRLPVVPRSRKDGGLGVACFGPGSFARQLHLPNLAALAPRASLRAVVGRSAHTAREAARRFAADYASTEIDEVLRDETIDLILICTRHDLHAEQAIRALEAGKAVFLEKPAALDDGELERLEAALRVSDQPFTVGFNRRFAPDVLALRRLLDSRRGPLQLSYRINAGRLPAEHWALGPEGGGRLIGEACHMIDLLGHLVGRPRTAHALTPMAPPAGSELPLGDNFALSCRYSDGSLATLVYTAVGHSGPGKERLEAHWDGRSAVIDDFLRLDVHGVAGANLQRDVVDKGHRTLLERFVEHAAGRGPEPIPRQELLDVSRFVLQLDREARGGSPATDAT